MADFDGRFLPSRWLMPPTRAYDATNRSANWVTLSCTARVFGKQHPMARGAGVQFANRAVTVRKRFARKDSETDQETNAPRLALRLALGVQRDTEECPMDRDGIRLIGAGGVPEYPI